MFPIITISREVGSGGHTIGEMVANELNLPLLDKYFIDEVTRSTGIKTETIEKSGEFLFQLEKLMSARFYNGLYLGDEQDDLFAAQKKIICEHAEKGPCVIIGRCSDAILRQKGIPALNIFIHADMDFRKENYKKRFPDLDTDIEKLMNRKDKGRRGYYRFYTDQEWGDVRNYALCLDSSKLGFETCAQLIVQAAKAMAAESE